MYVLTWKEETIVFKDIDGVFDRKHLNVWKTGWQPQPLWFWNSVRTQKQKAYSPHHRLSYRNLKRRSNHQGAPWLRTNRIVPVEPPRSELVSWHWDLWMVSWSINFACNQPIKSCQYGQSLASLGTTAQRLRGHRTARSAAEDVVEVSLASEAAEKRWFCVRGFLKAYTGSMGPLDS